jgi:hypothetical protein
VANLRPRKKGQSGNPNGRPKKTLITDALRARLAEIDPNDPASRTNAEVIADRMIARAKLKDRGQQDAAEIADRTEGKPRQTVGVEAKLDSANISALSREMVEARICDLLTKARARSLAQKSDGEL